MQSFYLKIEKIQDSYDFNILLREKSSKYNSLTKIEKTRNKTLLTLKSCDSIYLLYTVLPAILKNNGYDSLTLNMYNTEEITITEDAMFLLYVIFSINKADESDDYKERMISLVLKLDFTTVMMLKFELVELKNKKWGAFFEKIVDRSRYIVTAY